MGDHPPGERLPEEVASDGQGAVRVTIRGEIDLSRSERFEQAVVEAEGLGPRELRIDLREVGFMDSQGIAVLLRARARAQAGGWRLVLHRPPPPVWRVFQVTGLDAEFDFDDAAQGDRDASADAPS